MCRTITFSGSAHGRGRAFREGRSFQGPPSEAPVRFERTAARTEVAMDDAQGVEVGKGAAQLPSDVLQAQQPRHRVAVLGRVLRRVEVRAQAPG